jgi:tetratricopeptide (TPR) repeat protein
MRHHCFAAVAATVLLASRLFAGDPVSAEEFQKRGAQRSADGDLKGAVADFTAALKLDSKLVAAWIGRGNAMANSGDTDGAIADWSEAIALDPKNPKPLCNRAWFRFEKKGEIDAALEDFDRAIELDPKFGLAFTNRGLVKRAKRDFDGAAEDFTAARKIDPKDGMAHWNLVVLEYWRQDFGRASTCAAVMLAAIDKDEFWRDYAAILSGLCSVRLREDITPDAAVRRIFKDRDGKAAGQWTASIAAFLRGDLAEEEFLKLKDGGEGHEAKDQACQGWFYAGSVRLAAGDAAKAREYFEKCVALEAKGFDEWELAKVELARLKEKK